MYIYTICIYILYVHVLNIIYTNTRNTNIHTIHTHCIYILYIYLGTVAVASFLNRVSGGGYFLSIKTIELIASVAAGFIVSAYTLVYVICCI